MKIKLLDPSLKITLQDPKITMVSGVVYEVGDVVGKKLLEEGLVAEVIEESVKE
jgi:hypothetical protein